MVHGRTPTGQDLKKELALQKQSRRKYGHACQNCGYDGSNCEFYKLRKAADGLANYRIRLCFKCFQTNTLKTPLVCCNVHDQQKTRVREAWNKAVRAKSQNQLERPQNTSPTSSGEAVGCESPGASSGGSLSPYTASAG